MAVVVDVEALDVGRAEESLLSRLVTVVNAAYAIGECGLWRAGVSRIDQDTLSQVAARGELVIARSGGAAQACVRVRELADDTVEIGMLATDPANQRSGLGSALMDFAEDRARSAGRTSAELDLLVPVVGTHPAKQRLAQWYARRGYAFVSQTRLEERYPELVGDLRVPCTMHLWRKML